MLTKKSLREMKINSNSSLQKAVITDLLSQGTTQEIVCYIKDVLNHGCISGTVSMLIYYKDTEAFFKKHFAEIFDLLNEIKEELGEYPNFEINSNNLSWFAYEEVTRKIAYEFEIEY